MNAQEVSPRPGNPANPLSLALFGLAVLLLGIAVHIREGLYRDTAVAAMLLALAAVAAGVWIYLRPPYRDWMEWLPGMALGAAVILQWSALFASYPGSIWNAPKGDARQELSELKDRLDWLQDPVERPIAERRAAELEHALRRRPFQAGMMLAAILGAVAMARRHWLRWTAFGLLLLTHAWAGVYLLRTTPSPYIDVYVFQQESARALLEGRNPYRMQYANIYGENAKVYDPALMKEGQLEFGYPYPPLSLFMALPGYAILGDHRYGQLLALGLSGLMIALMGRGRMAMGAAMALLFSPRLFMVVEMAWSEPYVVALLCATVLCALRWPAATAYAFGLLLASKQYMVLAIPLAVLLAARKWPGFLVRSILVAAAVTLPLALWDPPAFIHSAVVLQMRQPFRSDSLSCLAALWWNGGEWLAPRLWWTAFVLAIGAIGVALGRLPRRPEAFAAGLALVMLAFLACNKQAFCNYYLLPIAALCCTIARQHATGRPDL